MFALKGLAESSEEELGEEDEDEDAEEPPSEAPKKKTKPTKKKTKESKAKKTAESSEDELSDEDEEEESWGHKKSAYYSSNAAQIESDDEEAQEMEEQEARRLQAKLRAPMREEDFGYSEALQRAVDVKPVEYVHLTSLFMSLPLMSYLAIFGNRCKSRRLSWLVTTEPRFYGIWRKLVRRRSLLRLNGKTQRLLS